MQLRFHRGSLKESMATVIEINSKEELVAAIKKELDLFELDEKKLSIGAYLYDDRTGWHTYLIMLEGWGVVGFSNEKIEL